MLRCTPTAAATLRKVREDNAIPHSYGVRLFAATTPDGDVGLGVDFAAEPAAGDQVTEQHGTTLMVAPELSEQLTNQTLDVVPDPSMDGHGPPQLVLRPTDDG